MQNQFFLKLFLIAIAIHLFSLSFGQENSWKLKTKKDNITIHTRSTKNSKIKELKMTIIVKSNLASIVNILNEVELYPDWMYGCKAAKKIESINNTEGIYSTTIEFPRPFSDRYVVSKTTIHQDTTSKIITIKSVAINDKNNQKKKMVRIKNMTSSWILIPKENGEVQIESYLFCDPEGNIPSWVINKLLHKSPSKSMINLTKRLAENKHKNKKLATILEK